MGKPVAVMVSRPPTNSLGVAGAIVSTVGLLTCGLLSPIGLLFSLVGMLKAPRGAALAGVVIGAFGTLLLSMIGISALALMTAVGPGLESVRDALVSAAGTVAVKEYFDQHGQLPEDDEAASSLRQWMGEVSSELRYTRLDEQRFEIRQAGPDETWDTPDDRRTQFNIADWDSPAAPPPDDHPTSDADPAADEPLGQAPPSDSAQEMPSDSAHESAAEPPGSEPAEDRASESPSDPPAGPGDSSLQPMSDVIFALT